MSQTDDITRLTAIVTRNLVLSGRARQYRQSCGASLPELGKAAGTSGARVGQWESGKATPTCQQALAWLNQLLELASWREKGAEAAK